MPKACRQVTRLMAFAAFVPAALAQSAPTASAPATQPRALPPGFYGSSACRSCHEGFYQKWATSFHGLAMQPFSAELAQGQLTPHREGIRIRDARYRAEIENGGNWVVESGPAGEKKYTIEHVMGGKNVYYFLTPLDRGRLQVLPIAYDVRRKAWLDTTGSAVRHFGDRRDEPLDWREPQLTFNTSCYGCHVSQLSVNYDAKTDTYKTTWSEPGINCETCHGPSGEHVRLFQNLPAGQKVADIRTISTKTFTVEQTNTMCGPCHAKVAVLTTDFRPGDRFFDHYDLVTLEDPDFYPDGRDLGENYTYTGWLMSPCVKSGKLSCVHCHTSSGRNRFPGDQANNACMPCHKDKVENAAAHTHHKAGGEGGKCVACHMPMTEFARMRRSDHSMRPPMPSATVAFKSPNACNLCHGDKDAVWADAHVRAWRSRDYQAGPIRTARLIDAARRDDWSKLPEILAALAGAGDDAVLANSLVRLLRNCDDDRKWPALLAATRHASPLVRASAVETLIGRFTPEVVAVLLAATRDDFRLVRIRAAASLAGLPAQTLNDADRSALEKATAEFEQAMTARPDDHAAHYNLGNYHMSRQDYERAVASFETSSRLQPYSIPPRVNASLAYNALGRNDKAEESLRQALKLDPNNAAANLNLGLLLAEMDRLAEAEAALRAAFKADPRAAVAAYNLGVICAEGRIDEAIDWCRKAHELRPQEPRYAYTYAFYLARRGEDDKAIDVLREVIRRAPQYEDAYGLLGQLYELRGRRDDAISVYRQALGVENLSDGSRLRLQRKIEALSGR